MGRKRQRRYRVQPSLAADRRLKFGHVDTLLRELGLEDTGTSFNIKTLQLYSVICCE